MSTYTGRLGKICDTIRFRANLGGDNTIASEAQLLALVNDCQRDLAQSLYYRKEALVDVDAGVDTIDLTEAVPDLYELYGLFWAENKRRLFEIQSDIDAKKARMYFDAGTPQAFYIRQNDLQLIPAPIATATDALVILYHYTPSDLSGETATAEVGSPGDPDYEPAMPDGTTPEGVLAADDEVFVLYALAQIYARDRHAKLAIQMGIDARNMYEARKRRMANRNHRVGRVRPYR